MKIPRAIAFVDGENLVMRYQAMLNAGFIARKDVRHIPDCFVWHPKVTAWSMFDFIRINYYTSTTGDAPRVEALKDQICNTDYSFGYTLDKEAEEATANLVPHVFRKPSRNAKARNVDLQISIDFLRAAHLPSVDMLLLLSGDGDYIPLVQEAARYGKEVWLGAFSSGFNARLRHHVDVYNCLDEIFFEPVGLGVQGA